MKQWLLSLVALMLSLGLGAGQSFHFLTIDEDGKPVPGVAVELSWHINDGQPHQPIDRGVFVSDESGCACTGTNVTLFARIESVKKFGYKRERYLNMHAQSHYIQKDYPKDCPYRIILRRLNPEKDAVVWRSGDRHGFTYASRARESVPLPLWAVETDEGKKHMAADCFASTRFDEVKQAWMCSFWTTNVNGGVQVATNRVFVAPATGYRQRIEVPLEMCFHPSFTLYVKTFEPQLYAMFCIYGYGFEEKPWERDSFGSSWYYEETVRPSVEKPYGVLQVESYHMNPFGGRVLELDYPLVSEAMGSTYDWPLLAELEQHRYPPRPDLAARLKNRQRQEAIDDQIRQCQNLLWELRSRREAILRRNAVANQPVGSGGLKQLEKDKKAVCDRSNELYKELYRLQKEARTLNLPLGVTEKDKYPEKK